MNEDVAQRFRDWLRLSVNNGAESQSVKALRKSLLKFTLSSYGVDKVVDLPPTTCSVIMQALGIPEPESPIIGPGDYVMAKIGLDGSVDVEKAHMRRHHRGPERMKFPIKIGNTIISDLLNPQPEELDLDAMTERLKGTLRFSGASGALSIHQHRHLVNRMVRESRDDFAEGEDGGDLWDRCAKWAYRHDDHEGVVGDIIAPVKNLISAQTNVLDVVEESLDRAICIRIGLEYPSEVVKGMVHRYDKAAETLEWVFALDNRLEEFNHPCPDRFMARGHELIQWARQHT